MHSKSQMLVKNVGQHVGTHSKSYGHKPFGHNNNKISQQNKENQQQIKENFIILHSYVFLC